MALPQRNILGIEIPSDSPVFLTVLFFHILAALGAVVTGLTAMLNEKRSGRHPRFGTYYYGCLGLVFLSATMLATMRWREDAYLFFLGALSFAAATIGRVARQQRKPHWAPIHIVGMGSSYIVMLIAFYMDNGRNLPVWKALPTTAYWLVPVALGVPLIARALVRYRSMD